MEILKTVADALEKQVAKTPLDIEQGEGLTFNGFCPVCASWANSDYKYCNHCGQRLGW